jgi:HAD superfamily hydrolase (TIGR01509 family)
VPVLLCDLDDTLFDHQHATRTALATLQARDARLQAWPLEDLKVRHHILLEQFHQEVLAGRLTIDQARERRFAALVGGGDAVGLAEAYRAAYTSDWREVEGAAALLHAVRALGWPVVIVTNNIVSEQRMKIARIGLDPLVDHLVTSEEVGVQKPKPEIFHHALATVGASVDEAVMLGDAWVNDVEGARGVGIRPVWLNIHGTASPDTSVAELRALTPTADVMRTLGAFGALPTGDTRRHADPADDQGQGDKQS